jgi:hypothetical protein
VPVGVLPDTANGFYISDVDTDTVRYVDANGTITAFAGAGSMQRNHGAALYQRC